MLEISAPAKINLALDVTGKEGRLHTVDTLIYPVSLHDTVGMKPSDVTTVKYVGKRGVYPGDTVLKTLELYKKIYGERGVEIEIIKRIPEKAGLGGSSADAAAVARGLEELFLYPSVGAEKLLEVGSDVPAMYENSPQRATSFGKGRRLSSLRKNLFRRTSRRRSGYGKVLRIIRRNGRGTPRSARRRRGIAVRGIFYSRQRPRTGCGNNLSRREGEKEIAFRGGIYLFHDGKRQRGIRLRVRPGFI